MADSNNLTKSSWMLTLAAIAVVTAALYLAKGLLVPLTLALLLSFLLSPVCDWLERRRLGRIPAVLVTAILAFAVLGILAWTTVVQMTDLAPKLPEYQKNIEAKLHSTNAYVSAALSKVTRTAQGMGQNLSQSEQAQELLGGTERSYSVRVISSPPSPLKVFGGMFGTLLEVLGSTGIVIVLVVFFLVRREDLRDRFIRLVGQGQVTVTTQALEDAATRVSRYLSMQFLINVSFGVPVAIGLYFIGVPNAILWGILATALRFIPYIGPWIAAATPIGLSMVISTGWVAPILTVGLFVVLELVSNNVMEPWLYGKNTGVSPVAVLVAAVFWLWLWGPVGLLLATPLTVCLLVIGRHVPQLSFLDTLLGNEPVFEPKTRIYQRLLAGDQEEAAELIEGYLEHLSLGEVYDTVLIPALALAETHFHHGEINESKHKFIFQALKETVEELGERQQALQAKEATQDAKEADADSNPVGWSNSSRIRILCLPARDEADEIAGMMLAQLLAMKGCNVQAVSVTALASEMVDLVEQRKADVVCISAMPPAAATHARYLCKRLRGRFPEGNLVVGLWHVKGDLNKARERIGYGATAHVVATLADAQEQIRLLIEPLLLRSEQELLPSLDQLAKDKDSPLRFQPVHKESRQKLDVQGEESMNSRRNGKSSKPTRRIPQNEKRSKKSEPVERKLLQSPTVAKSADQLGNDHAPPKAHEVPKPDPKVEPKPRKPGGKAESPKRRGGSGAAGE
jgi:predicted PurR-regulated permease PerM/methylmalonyl-CoA mutase cobalamin-binding subunit